MEDTLSKDYNDKSGLAYYWLEENIGRILLIVLFTGIGLWGLLLEGRTGLSPIQGLARGMGPELAGIVIAAATIDALGERRREQDKKAQLIRQLGSRYRDVTEAALIELEHKGWLYDGSLNMARLFSSNLSDAALWRANLGRADLRRAELSGANLQGANLSGADLRGADLSGAYLREANLSWASLWETDLSGANLWRANLSESHFREANLSRAHLPEAYLVGTSLWGADLSGAYLQGANLTRATLPLANLSGANLWRVNLSGANLLGADLSGVSFWAANLSMASLSEANLSGATEWTIRQIKSVETLKGAIMPDGVQLTGEYIEGTILEEWETDYLARHGGTETDIRDRMYDT